MGLSPGTKLPCALGTQALSPIRPDSLHHLRLLPPPSVVHHGRSEAYLRNRARTRTRQIQPFRLWLRCNAQSYSPADWRAATRNARRSDQVVEVGRVAAIDRRCQPHSGRSATTTSTSAITSSLSRNSATFTAISEERLVRTPTRLGVGWLSPPRNRLRRTRRDRVRVDSKKARAFGFTAISIGGLAPLKPKDGLNGSLANPRSNDKGYIYDRIFTHPPIVSPLCATIA